MEKEASSLPSRDRRRFRKLTTFTDYMEQAENAGGYFAVGGSGQARASARGVRKGAFTPKVALLKPSSPKSTQQKKGVIAKGTISFSRTGICFLRMSGSKSSAGSVLVLTPRILKPTFAASNKLQKDSASPKLPTEYATNSKRKYSAVLDLNQGELILFRKKTKRAVKSKNKLAVPAKNAGGKSKPVARKIYK